MCQLARCRFPLVRTDYYQRAFGRHQLLHAIERVLQHRAPADDWRKLSRPSPPQSCLRKPRTLVPSPPAKTIAHTLAWRTKSSLAADRLTNVAGTRATFVPNLWSKNWRVWPKRNNSFQSRDSRPRMFRASDTDDPMFTTAVRLNAHFVCQEQHSTWIRELRSLAR
jgi:hypothetical protein